MNKAELIEKISTKAELSKTDANRALDAVLESITEALTSGEQLALVGFGTFSVKERAARMGRNPRTGESMPIAAATVPSFKPGKGLKDAVNV